ncbi:MAG: DUF3108 domain-containing protein [Haliea sp.]
MLLTTASISSAEEASADAPAAVLQPYKAEYTTTARGMTVTLERELKTDGEGGYTLTNGGKLLVVGFHEVAVFRVDDTQVKPGSYIYQGTGLINRRREVHFTPGADTVRSLYKEEWYELPFTEGTLDRMSQQEQLRLHLMSKENPRENISVRIADGKRVKDYELVYVGDETLDTPLGPVNALHFERLHEDPDRESDIWFAPQWDYLMVKTVHIEDGKPVEVLLSDADIGGNPVVAASGSQ